jgi:phage baseplate assembly protein W|tara:strand:- start:2193 stop:2603 length:411 start_codon:yes stop_codon:yes gene_type:complete
MAGLTPRTQAQEFYSDFSKNLDQIPGRKDLSRLLNENSIKESIKNIVLTNKGERLFQPNFGCDINASLFENIDNNTVLILRDNIKRAIRTFEPRCDLKNVEIIADLDTNNLQATVVFSVINTSSTTSLTLDLVRER